MRPLLLAAVAAVVLLPSARPVLAVDLPSVIRAAAGREATFVQKFTPRGFRKEQIERGRVVFGEAPRMRWTYGAPEQKVFVFDGATSWLYTPSDRQVIVTRLGEAERKSIPLAFLWDPQASADLAVTTTRKGRETVLSMTPRTADTQIRAAEAIVGADGLIRSMSWTDRQGNRTVFEFSEYRRAQTSAATFRFAPPAGTDIVESNGGRS